MYKLRFRTTFTILAIIVFIGMSGCDAVTENREELLKEVDNEFAFQQETYSLSWGTIIDYKSYKDGLRSFDISVYEEMENMGKDYINSDSRRANSDYILSFYILADTENGELPVGKYVYGENNDAGRMGVVWLLIYEDGVLTDKSFKFDSGEVEVSKNEDIYLVEFSLETEDGKKLEGAYKNEFDHFDIDYFQDLRPE